MPSEIHSLIAKRVHEEGHKLRQSQVDPWFFFGIATPFKVNTFYGKTISYEGIRFEGTPRDVFWGRYIEPFIEDISERVISETAREAIERHISLEPALREAERYLKQLVRSTYERMVEVDARLRGNGDPRSVSPRNIDSLVSSMEQHIEERVRVEINAPKRERGLSAFYNKNPFLFWALGTAIAIVLALIAL